MQRDGVQGARRSTRHPPGVGWPDSTLCRARGRRSVWLVLGGLAVGVAVGFSLPLLGLPRPPGPDPTRYVTVNVADLPVGGVRQAGEFWIVHEPDGSFAALVGRDTHGGVTVWNPPEQLFHSPGRGEMHDLTGKCVGGPCSGDLCRVVSVVDGKRLIIWPALALSGQCSVPPLRP